MPDSAPQQEPKLWIPPENYYEQVGESNTNSLVNYVGRLGVAAYTLVAFGRIKIVTTPGFDEAQPSFSDGNIIVASIHRDERDTVMLPLALERVGIHHSRPVAKSELYTIHPLVSDFFHAAGAFAVDRKNPDFKGLGLAQDRILARGGNITNYLEGTRIRRNTHEVADVKRSVVFAAAEHDSLIVPVAFAGLSSEIEGDGENKRKISRDKRSRFGIGRRLVFAFTDPMRFGALPEAEFETDGKQTLESKNAIREESKRRAARIKSGMQLALDMAIEHRGSTQEYKYKPTK